MVLCIELATFLSLFSYRGAWQTLKGSVGEQPVHRQREQNGLKCHCPPPGESLALCDPCGVINAG